MQVLSQQENRSRRVSLYESKTWGRGQNPSARSPCDRALGKFARPQKSKGGLNSNRMSRASGKGTSPAQEPIRKWRNRIVGTGEEDAEQLLANPKNWRVHPKNQQDALQGVLSAVGWVQHVIVNRRTGFVVDGHARVAMAISAHEKVPVVYVDLSEEEEAVILATLDPLAAMAGKDEDAFKSLVDGMDDAFKALVAATGGILALGFVKDQDDAPPLPEYPVSRPGDLWLLGEGDRQHRLLVGDATKQEDVDRVCGEIQVDAMWIDPPFGCRYVGKTKDALRIQNDEAGSVEAMMVDALKAIERHLIPCAPFYIAHPAGPLASTFARAVETAGWRVHQGLVWCKDSMVLGHSDYHYQHEPILYGFAPGPGRPGRGRHEGTR